MKKIGVVFLLLILLVVAGGVAAQNGATILREYYPDSPAYFCPTVTVDYEITTVTRPNGVVAHRGADILVTYNGESFRDHVSLGNYKEGCDGCRGVGFIWPEPGGRPIFQYTGYLGSHFQQYVDEGLETAWNAFTASPEGACVAGETLYSDFGAEFGYCWRYNVPASCP